MRQQDIPVLGVYAEALHSAAVEAGQLDAIFREAQEAFSIIGPQNDLRIFLSKPAIEKEQKKKLVRAVFGGRLSPIMLHLPLLLVDKNRGGLWGSILEYFIKMVEAERGIMDAELATSQALPADLKDLLQNKLQAFTGKTLRISWKERPELIGGVFFRYDNIIIDTTLQTALKGLAEKLQAVRVN